MIYQLGATSVSVDVQIVDDNGLPVTGLVAATFPTLTYSLAGANADVAFPALSDLATITTAYSSGGVKERGNGYYRLDVPNGAFTTGGVVTIRGEATGKHVLAERLHIVAYSPQDATRLGLSALPNAAANANGGLPILSSAGTTLAYTISTLTTYTGNTPQTGDAYAVVNNGTYGNSALHTQIGSPWQVGTKYAVTLASTDVTGNLPADAKAINAVSTSSVTTVNANIGSAQPFNFVGTGASAEVKSAPDWANIQNPTTVVNLSGTTIATLTNSVSLHSYDSPNMAAGTAAAATSTTITLGSSPGADNCIVGCLIRILSGTGANQARTVTGYVASTKVVTVDRAWAVTPDATSGYSIFFDDAPAKDSNLAVTFNNTSIATVTTTTNLTNLPSIPNNWLTAAGIAAGALNGKGDWLLASSYTAPPTAAQNATAVWTDATAGDFTTAGTPGKILVGQLGGTFTTTTSSVFTAAALANAPGGGGNVTVGGYAAGQDPATLVLDVLAANHNNANTVGAKINAAGSAADPLTNNVPGSYATGTAGYALGRIGTGTITTSSIVAVGGSFSVYRGDSYYAADGRALTWQSTSWPNLTGASAAISLYGTSWTHTVSVTSAGGTTQTIQLELAATETATMPISDGSKQFRIQATLADGHVATLVDSTYTVSGA